MSRRQKLQQMLQENPQDTFLLYALAMEDRSAGDDSAALVQLDRVLAADPQYVAAYFQKGQVLAGQSRFDEARQILQEGVAIARQAGDAHAAGEMAELLSTLE